MAVAVPPVYSWRSVPSQASQSFGAVELALQKDTAVAVELQFSFPFFGLEYRLIWVSSFGMVLFDQPSALGSPFGGVGSTHSAIGGDGGRLFSLSAGQTIAHFVMVGFKRA